MKELEVKELVDVLRVCADDEIICPACGFYGNECDGSYAGPSALMLRSAELLEQQQKRIEELTARIQGHTAENQACFRLGQMDMKQSCLDMLEDAMEYASGIHLAMLKDVITWIGTLELSWGISDGNA